MSTSNNLVIYKITNLINQKTYIGQTYDYETRKRHHIGAALHNWKESSRPLYQAMKKYGINNFSFEIIDQAETEEELNQKEIYYIEYYNSSIDKNGYNLDLGGKNGHKSDYVKRKIGDSQRGELNHMYGRRFEKSPNSKPVINETKNVRYCSLRKCAIEEYGSIDAVKQISKVCDPYSNRFTYNNQVYKFLDENDKPINKKVGHIKCGRKPIKDTITNKEYNSIKEASIDTGLSESMIRDRVYNRIKNDKFKNIHCFVLINKNDE